jgi:hypothetical protein
MNFEAVLPNPQPELGLEGCRPVANFWASLSSEPDAMARATRLESFYFTGLTGFSPVVSANNYGNNATRRGPGAHQPVPHGRPPTRLPRPGCCMSIKLREWRLRPRHGEDESFGGLFNPASQNRARLDFQNHFLSQVASLAINDLNRFTWSVPDTFNSAE